MKHWNTRTSHLKKDNINPENLKNCHKRRILAAMLTLSMLFGICTVATAAGNPAATNKSLHSQGAIRFQEGTESVVIDSDDLYTLADRLDLFKVRTAEQLGLIGTYLSRGSAGTPLTSAEGIYAVHQKPSASSEADPLSLSFETILEGIAVSQTIPTDPTAYGMDAGISLYQDADGKLSTVPQNGSEPIRIQAATAENLSAGTAAWVNGKLILGTGSDNRSYHDLGYRKGYDAQDNDVPGGDDGPGSGDDNPGSGDDAALGKARVINMNNGSANYVVQEDMTDVFLCFAHLDRFITPVLSSGESIKLVLKASNETSHYYHSIYYIPKLTKGTTISNLYASKSENVMNLLITIAGSCKNGNVHGMQLSKNETDKDYIVGEDLTDVLLYVRGSKDKMPDFTPMDGQPYVPFKLLKSIYHQNNATDASAGCLYYIPVLKAGTRISNTKPYRCYMVY